MTMNGMVGSENVVSSLEVNEVLNRARIQAGIRFK